MEDLEREISSSIVVLFNSQKPSWSLSSSLSLNSLKATGVFICLISISRECEPAL